MQMRLLSPTMHYTMNCCQFIGFSLHKSSTALCTRFFSSETSHRFVCNNCGKVYTKWQGQCYSCNTWNSIEEEQEIKNSSQKLIRKIKPLLLNDIQTISHSRIQLSGTEMNRVLGGGVVPGSLVLIGGEPGIGKSTLLLRIASDICNSLSISSKKGVLYVSGEESEDQVKMRCDRLGVNNKNLYLIHETNIDSIVQLIHQHQDIFASIIIDSIQTTELYDCNSGAGSVTQVRLCTYRLQELAKSLGISVFVSGHVTKTGDLAGPRTLEHIVDTVLYLEGDPITDIRILRSMKNRFGPSNEIGLFEMNQNGLIEKSDLYSSFLTSIPRESTKTLLSEGSSVGIIINGSRSLPIEFQALTNKVNTQFRPPQSRCIGLSFDRLQLLLAVLKSKEKYAVGSCDVFVNVVGGIQVFESGADLPVIISLVSSLKKEAISSSTCFIGEIGLTGELRPVQQMESRLKAASSLGFQQCYTPFVDGSILQDRYGKMEVIQKKKLRDVIDDVFIG